ncbi:hypothetical protein DRJ22_02380 [Candidatus Woesearchaeota archaeon]|nr:MAG: hypothetical protein DRJ22_02380 [Candidatus Woesearchaeota archaeon]
MLLCLFCLFLFEGKSRLQKPGCFSALMFSFLLLHLLLLFLVLFLPLLFFLLLCLLLLSQLLFDRFLLFLFHQKCRLILVLSIRLSELEPESAQ